MAKHFAVISIMHEDSRRAEDSEGAEDVPVLMRTAWTGGPVYGLHAA